MTTNVLEQSFILDMTVKMVPTYNLLFNGNYSPGEICYIS